MVILKENSTVQRFTFIPTRLSDANYLVLTNETTNEVTTKSINVKKKSYYSYFDLVFDFIEQGHVYNVALKYYGIIDGKLDYHLAHRDKIFCTNQNVETYSVNKDVYVQNDQNIIFYE
jgi:hypothetical protein